MGVVVATFEDGWDTLLSRLVDIISRPTLLLAITIVGVLGESNQHDVHWIVYAPSSRAFPVAPRWESRTSITSSLRARRCSSARIIVRHVLPTLRHH